MTDTEILREVLDYATWALDISAAFHDAATVLALSEIVNIIEGGVADSDVGSISDG